MLVLHYPQMAALHFFSIIKETGFGTTGLFLHAELSYWFIFGLHNYYMLYASSYLYYWTKLRHNHFGLYCVWPVQGCGASLGFHKDDIFQSGCQVDYVSPPVPDWIHWTSEIYASGRPDARWTNAFPPPQPVQCASFIRSSFLFPSQYGKKIAQM